MKNDYTRYKEGDRDPAARAANAAYARARRAGGPTARTRHGRASTYELGCKCGPCRLDKRQERAAERERNDETGRRRRRRALVAAIADELTKVTA